jgi:hypothetical protein
VHQLNSGRGRGTSWVASENACVEITGRLSLSGSYTTLLKLLQGDALRPCGCAFCSGAPPNHVTSELLKRASKQTIWRNPRGWDVRIHVIRAWPALWCSRIRRPELVNSTTGVCEERNTRPMLQDQVVLLSRRELDELLKLEYRRLFHPRWIGNPNVGPTSHALKNVQRWRVQRAQRGNRVLRYPVYNWRYTVMVKLVENGVSLRRVESISLDYFEPLSRVPGAQLFSFQKNAGLEQLAAFKGRFPVTDLGSKLDESTGPFLDTAAVLKNLEFFITSDTAVAHLAGALGVPVWMALSTTPDWRWMNHREEDCISLVSKQRKAPWLFPGTAEEDDIGVAVVVKLGASKIKGINLLAQAGRARAVFKRTVAD